jgi:protein-tyrosine-phosphatase
MGLFSRRRKRESATPPSTQLDQSASPPGSFASPEGQPVVGRPVGGDVVTPEMADGVAGLSQLGPMIQEATASGDLEVEQGSSQTIDMRATGLREEILAIMRQHGIDPESGTTHSIDPSTYGDMQQQILAALAKHGIDPGASGSAINFQVDPDGER